MNRIVHCVMLDPREWDLGAWKHADHRPVAELVVELPWDIQIQKSEGLGEDGDVEIRAVAPRAKFISGGMFPKELTHGSQGIDHGRCIGDFPCCPGLGRLICPPLDRRWGCGQTSIDARLQVHGRIECVEDFSLVEVGDSDRHEGRGLAQTHGLQIDFKVLLGHMSPGCMRGLGHALRLGQVSRWWQRGRHHCEGANTAGIILHLDAVAFDQ